MTSSVTEDLRERAAWNRKMADEDIDRAERFEGDARKNREEARTLRLAAIEADVAANIVEGSGLAVSMGADGNPLVEVNPAAETPAERPSASLVATVVHQFETPTP